MILRNLELVGSDRPMSDLRIAGRLFTGVDERSTQAPGRPGREPTIDFANAIAAPGLVNSHDHLEFDLYPSLGHRRYRDYMDWGSDIHNLDRTTIAAIERLPRALRIEWGALKNLLAGVTTAAHHGPGGDGAVLDRLPIACVRRGTPIHSLRRGGHWRWHLNRPRPRPPFVIHVGEGTSRAAQREVDRLLRWNLMGRDLVGVHAIAMNDTQASRFHAVVWCPMSNDFLFGATADIARLKARTAILFGTDSTLTSHWNFWVHLRAARASGALTDPELFDAVTSVATDVWGLPGTGRVAEGSPAHLVVARKKAASRWDAFFAIDPEDLLLVLHNGEVRLLDTSIQGVQLPPSYSRIQINGSTKIVATEVGHLLDAIRAGGIQPNLPVTVH